MPFAPGDAVHVKAIGKGVLREARNRGRWLVDVNGRLIETTEDQLTPREERRKPARAKAVVRDVYAPAATESRSLDLHGLTVDEAVERVAQFLNDAILAGSLEVRIIHGRSGGRLKTAIHAQLKQLPSIRRFAMDPRNPGVTIVEL